MQIAQLHVMRHGVTTLMMLAALKLYDATSIVIESDDPELLPQMQSMSQVAQLLVALVKASARQFPDDDHLSNTRFQVGHMLDRHTSDADTRVLENSHASSWSRLSEGYVNSSMTREAWPTPTAAAWLERSTVALKALTTLRWLNKPEQLQKLADETPKCLPSAAQSRPVSTAAYQAVGESLLQLLHCCLAGGHTAHWAHLNKVSHQHVHDVLPELVRGVCLYMHSCLHHSSTLDPPSCHIQARCERHMPGASLHIAPR